MTLPDYDVVVVGTGPGGGIAAYELARTGFSVLILERNTLPRYKPCGGGVTTKALRLLDFDVSSIVERNVNQARIWCGSRRYVDVDGRDMGRMFMRSSLDEYIVRRAVQAGASLIETCTVKTIEVETGRSRVRSTCGDFHGRYVIGADGTDGVVSKALGAGPLDCGVAIEAEIEVAADCVEAERVLFDFGAVEAGYGYVFPKARHLSVGLYSMRPAVAQLRQKLDRYLVSGRIPPATRIRSCIGHRVPVGRLRDKLQAYGILLVGDAAGMADPVWGEGIYYALRSGQIAAEEVGRALRDGKSTPSRYPTILREQLGRNLFWARMVAAVLYRLPERGLVQLVRDERLSGMMMGVLRGDTNYREYVQAVLRGLPRLTTNLLKPSAQPDDQAA
jgi:geranylgeranyl reductase family protein